MAGGALADPPGRESRSHYAAYMEQIAAGDLVKVATTGPQIDGIVFDVPSASKVVVAVVDRGRGARVRPVSRPAPADPAGAGADDRAPQLPLRRTPPPRPAAPPG